MRNLPDPPGISSWVIEQTMPGLVFSARTVDPNPISRAAAHSSGVIPPSSSRSRMVTMRAACDALPAPHRFIDDGISTPIRSRCCSSMIETELPTNS